MYSLRASGKITYMQFGIISDLCFIKNPRYMYVEIKQLHRRNTFRLEAVIKNIISFYIPLTFRKIFVKLHSHQFYFAGGSTYVCKYVSLQIFRFRKLFLRLWLSNNTLILIHFFVYSFTLFLVI